MCEGGGKGSEKTFKPAPISFCFPTDDGSPLLLLCDAVQYFVTRNLTALQFSPFLTSIHLLFLFFLSSIIRLFIYLFIYLFIRLFIYLFINLPNLYNQHQSRQAGHQNTNPHLILATQHQKRVLAAI